MKGKERTQRAKKTGRSLNLILWFAFSVFAILIIVVSFVVQTVLAGNRYREQELEKLRAANSEMLAAIGEEEIYGMSQTARRLYEISNRYGVGIFLVYDDGASVFPAFTEQAKYSELAESLRGRFANGNESASLAINTESELAYASVVTIEGKGCFLYLSSPLDPIRSFEASIRWIGVVTGAFAVVLAFIASGFVAMLITRPITEVTESAKELARGNYDVRPREKNFCAEIKDLSDALVYAGEEISKTDRMQKELIANVSHDFRTPLTMIKAYASMISDFSGEDPAKRREHAQVIIEESDRLAGLVEDLLDLSKVRAGYGGEYTVFNLSEEVYRIAGRFHYLEETQGYAIDVEVEDDIYAYADRERIEQVLYNLIGNAVNYTGEDKRVRVSLRRAEQNSRFEVSDTGKGIPPEEIPTIWDRYYRAKEMHKRPVKGSGLGLSIVKGILLSHKFRFGVESEIGKGSCFWVEFPEPPASEERTGTEIPEGGERK